jgi:xanthine dehydrogenase accessory factor
MSRSFFARLAAAAAAGRPFAVVTIVETEGSSPQKPGAKMIVYPDGAIEGTVGGGNIEHRLVKEAMASLAGRQAPRLLRYDLKADAGMICGGSMTAYVEPHLGSDPVLVFGCGHVCRALVPLLVSVGFDVTVVDDRSEWADPKAFPAGIKVVCEDMLAHAAARAALAGTYLLIVTRGHALDWKLLRIFVDRDPAYLGVMSSRGKAAELRQRLANEGVPKERIDRVHMPVGLAIGSTTPEEIAVSIAGQLIQERAARSGASPATTPHE